MTRKNWRITLRERNPDTDFQCELLEDTKAFLDDLHDFQIINLSKREVKDTPVPYLLTNKHGDRMGFMTPAMREAKRYCGWLIELGAVKVNVESPV